MAYNNYFPNNYTYPNFTQATPQPVSSLIWVQGEAGAKSYLVAPNTTIVLWDSESPVAYIKSADSSGMPSIKVLDYTVRQNTVNAPNPGFSSNTSNLPAYATKDEIKAITGELDTLKAQIDKLTKKRRDEDDE